MADQRNSSLRKPRLPVAPTPQIKVENSENNHDTVDEQPKPMGFTPNVSVQRRVRIAEAKVEPTRPANRPRPKRAEQVLTASGPFSQGPAARMGSSSSATRLRDPQSTLSTPSTQVIGNKSTSLMFEHVDEFIDDFQLKHDNYSPMALTDPLVKVPGSHTTSQLLEHVILNDVG